MGFDLDVLARFSGPRLTFPAGRRFAPSQGQARPLCSGDRALGSARSDLSRSPGASVGSETHDH